MRSIDRFILSMVILMAAIIVPGGCNDNMMARQYGGSERIELKPNQKLINITWKESSIWILTRNMRADEVPETYSFSEKSGWNVLEGNIVIMEAR